IGRAPHRYSRLGIVRLGGALVVNFYFIVPMFSYQAKLPAVNFPALLRISAGVPLEEVSLLRLIHLPGFLRAGEPAACRNFRSFCIDGDDTPDGQQMAAPQ